MGTSKWISAGWASGTIGSSTALGAMSIIVLFYLTEYVGLPPSVAGLLIFLSRIWDVFVSLAVGHWSDRIRGRWGRRVPFLLAGAPILGAAYFLLFAAPSGLSGGVLTGYILCTLLLYSTGYTLFVVPYLAVPAEITAIPQQRTTMMSYRVTAMTIASLVVATGPLLLTAFGGGRGGYAAMGAVHAVVIVLAMLGCSFVVSRAPVVVEGTSPAGSLVSQLWIIGQNKPFKIFIGVKFCQLMATAAVGASMLYMARYILGETETFLTRFTIYQISGTLLSLPGWSWLAKRFGKRATYMGAGYFYAFIALTWLTAMLGEPAWVTDVRMFMVGVAVAGLLVVGFSILPDTMEHNTRRTGVSQEGTLAAIYSIVEKGTAAIGPLIAGVILEGCGFVSAAGAELPPEQPRSAMIAILMLASVIPALFNVGGSLLLLKFDLKET